MKMTSIRVLIWKNKDTTVEPEVEVSVPSAVAKWVPRLMALVPKKAREEVWGDDVDFKDIFTNIDQLIAEALSKGLTEVVQVKTKDGMVKVLLEKD
jgi:hypothetical protein